MFFGLAWMAVYLLLAVLALQINGQAPTCLGIGSVDKNKLSTSFFDPKFTCTCKLENQGVFYLKMYYQFTGEVNEIKNQPDVDELNLMQYPITSKHLPGTFDMTNSNRFWTINTNRDITKKMEEKGKQYSYSFWIAVASMPNPRGNLQYFRDKLGQTYRDEISERLTVSNKTWLWYGIFAKLKYTKTLEVVESATYIANPPCQFVDCGEFSHCFNNKETKETLCVSDCDVESGLKCERGFRCYQIHWKEAPRCRKQIKGGMGKFFSSPYGVLSIDDVAIYLYLTGIYTFTIFIGACIRRRRRRVFAIMKASGFVDNYDAKDEVESLDSQTNVHF